MDALPKLFTALADRLDLLKHFSKEKAGWKLAALCVIKLPLAVALTCWAYWQTHH